MDNYYIKYSKYKNKYLKLKTQIGGELTPVEITEIFNLILNSNINKGTQYYDLLGDFYETIIKNKKYVDLKEYVNTNRDKGKKIMLIVGTVPEQKDKFIIPENFVPVFIEYGFDFEHYKQKSANLTDNIIRKKVLTSLYTKYGSEFSKYNLNNYPDYPDYPLEFKDYPLISDNITNFDKTLDIRFDLIVFDDAVCKFIDFNATILKNLFNLTQDNSSLIVIDGYRDISIRDILDIEKSTKLKEEQITDLMPRYNMNHYPYFIILKLNEWFQKYMKNIQINSSAYLLRKSHISTDFTDLCSFYFIIDNILKDNNPKTTLLYYNTNIFQTNCFGKFYLYFVNTKSISDNMDQVLKT